MNWTLSSYMYAVGALGGFVLAFFLRSVMYGVPGWVLLTLALVFLGMLLALRLYGRSGGGPEGDETRLGLVVGVGLLVGIPPVWNVLSWLGCGRSYDSSLRQRPIDDLAVVLLAVLMLLGACSWLREKWRKLRGQDVTEPGRCPVCDTVLDELDTRICSHCASSTETVVHVHPIGEPSVSVHTIKDVEALKRELRELYEQTGADEILRAIESIERGENPNLIIESTTVIRRPADRELDERQAP